MIKHTLLAAFMFLTLAFVSVPARADDAPPQGGDTPISNRCGDTPISNRECRDGDTPISNRSAGSTSSLSSSQSILYVVTTKEFWLKALVYLPY